MRRLFTLAFVGLVVVLAGFAAFLATWDIPAPTARIEKIIPNDRLPR
ncbi:MAG: hypothetical protein JNN22_03495 [Rhodospirillales bacterium]|nr:hypothetical protein [Rhodospirillales bacterium]